MPGPYLVPKKKQKQKEKIITKSVRSGAQKEKKRKSNEKRRVSGASRGTKLYYANPVD